MGHGLLKCFHNNQQNSKPNTKNAKEINGINNPKN